MKFLILQNKFFKFQFHKGTIITFAGAAGCDAASKISIP